MYRNQGRDASTLWRRSTLHAVHIQRFEVIPFALIHFGRSTDSKEDLMMIVRNHLLQEHVRSLGDSVYLLYGYTMNHITENILHSASNAMGYLLAYSSSVSSLKQIPNSNCWIGYPLGPCTSRELVLYCHYKNISFETDFTFLSTSGESVYRLARDMVESLQNECDSTVHIVTETVDKLQRCPETMSESLQICQLCGEYH